MNRHDWFGKKFGRARSLRRSFSVIPLLSVIFFAPAV